MRALRVLGLVLVVGFVGLSTTGAAAAAPVAAATAVPAAPVAAGALVAGTPCGAAARACVDLSSNQAWLLSGGAIQHGPVRIAHGGQGFRTPAGTFRVSFKSRNHVSSIYDSKMPYAVFFNGGIAFHQGDLGSRTHGCVRLSRGAAQTFFSSLNRGDVVQVVR